ncbi:FAD-dependent oxidoreductase [Reichenbachiella sp. MALMAid0571]|uniref:FAD-dependent oxidoreductase n=1 Tax=Reichenbachiella sp. MALMAid0571 TaxID=3143939 RepID=UPI0032DE3351
MISEIFNFNVIPVLFETDILVIGAGSAGCVAALAAAESGKYDVALVERYGFPGGTSTQMLDTFYGFFTPGEMPRKIVGGIPDRIVNELNATGDIFLRPNTYGAGTGVNYNPERLKYVWDKLIVEAGINYLLHTTLIEVLSEENERSTCVFWTKGGFYKIIAKRVIDASGDADFSYLSDYGFELAGENEPAQSLTTTFRMSNVDLGLFEKAGGRKMLKEKMHVSFESGKHNLPRKDGSVHEMCQTGCVSTVAVKVTDLKGLDARDLTLAEIEGRRQSYTYEDFFREEIPGFEGSKIIGLSNQIGVRETRRVYGLERLTKEHCMQRKVPEDSIFLCGAPIEDHRKGDNGEDETYWQYIPNDGVYGVSYGTIVPKDSKRSWVVGRCFSATHDAHASCRSMAQTMSMGQAAGLAANLSLDDDTGSDAVDTNKLRTALLEINTVLEVPHNLADTSRNGWSNNFK